MSNCAPFFSYENYLLLTWGQNPSSHGKDGWMKTYPLVKERIHSISQKIIRLHANPKHIHLIRKIISNVVHWLDVDSRWTCRWTSIMYFPDDKIYPQIQNSLFTCTVKQPMLSELHLEHHRQNHIRIKVILAKDNVN